MSIIIGVGDYGLGDILNESRDVLQQSQDLYNLLLDLCGEQLSWENVLNKPELYEKHETYSKEQIDDLLEDIAPGEHSHSISDVTDLQQALDDRYTIEQTDDLLEGKADVEHTHGVSEIEGLQAAIQALGIQVVETLPETVENGKIYIVHPEGSSNFSCFISADGVYIPLNAVTYSALSTALATKQNKLTGPAEKIVHADGSFGDFNKEAIGLGNVPNLHPSQWPISDAQAAINLQKANDGEVLKKTGNQTKSSGVLTFLVSPEVPTAANPSQAINLGQTQDLIQELAGDIFPQNEIIFEDASEEWIWMHNMNKKPSVDVIVAGLVVNARLEHLDNDTLKIIFSKPQTGSIIVR